MGDWCADAGIEVEFVPWTKFDIVDMLVSSADRRGLGLYWLNARFSTISGLRGSIWQNDLGERFQPDDHVVTDLSEVFDGLARTNDYKVFLADWFRNTPRPIDLGRHLRVVEPQVVDANASALDETLVRLRSHRDNLTSMGMESLPLSQLRQDIDAAVTRCRNCSSHCTRSAKGTWRRA